MEVERDGVAEGVVELLVDDVVLVVFEVLGEGDFGFILVDAFEFGFIFRLPGVLLFAANELPPELLVDLLVLVDDGVRFWQVSFKQ